MPNKTTIPIKENADKVIKPAVKLLDVISSSEPRPSGPTAIPRLDAAVIAAKPIPVCSGLTTSGNIENTDTGRKENPMPKNTAHNVKDNQGVVSAKKATAIMIRPINMNNFFLPVLSIKIPIIGVKKIGTNILILVKSAACWAGKLASSKNCGAKVV